MRLLEYAAVGLVLLALGVVIVIALLGAALGYLLRPLTYGERRRGVAPQSVHAEPITDADPGDETDVVPGGMGTEARSVPIWVAGVPRSKIVEDGATQRAREIVARHIELTQRAKRRARAARAAARRAKGKT